eukprot:gene19412-23245_t
MSSKNELFQGVEQRDVEKVKRLMNKPKRIKTQLTTFDQYGQSPLTLALKNNHEEMVDLLLQGFRETKSDINAKDKNGYTALHTAVSSDDKILMCVLQHENINVDVCNDDMNTPLHYFCQNFRSPNCQEPFALFLSKGVNVNAQNNNGETPLHKAIFNRAVRLMMVDLLLKAGANVNLLNTHLESPLHYSVRLGRDDLVHVLLKAGADVNLVGAREKKTPYDLAVGEGFKEMAARIKKYKDLFEWLQEHGLEQYKDAFVKEEMFKDVLGEINERILDKMGITAAGHRLRILKATSLFKEQLINNGGGASTTTLIATATSTTSTTTTTSGNRDILNDDDDFNGPDTPDISGLRDSLHALKHIAEINIILDDDLEYTEKLGAGSSGKVYKGLYKGKEVAIKVLKSMTEAREIEEFKKEFQIMSAIRSKHVVYFYGAVLEPKLCMVMENCIRGSLYHVMNHDNTNIGWEKTFRFAIETVRGIECLHKWEPQIVHRDLKSLNLLVNEKWEIKVCDFGLSRFNTGSNLETLVKMRGTFAYCAPEVYFGEQFSTKSDVYSIAVILWELVTRCINGRYERPFSEYKNLHHDFQIIIQTSKKGLRPTIPPACPPLLSQLIQDCWDPSSASRPSCTDIVNRLLQLETQYKSNTQQWDATIKPLGPTTSD